MGHMQIKPMKVSRGFLMCSFSSGVATVFQLVSYFENDQVKVSYHLLLGVKSHGSVSTSVFKSRFCSVRYGSQLRGKMCAELQPKGIFQYRKEKTAAYNQSLQ